MLILSLSVSLHPNSLWSKPPQTDRPDLLREESQISTHTSKERTDKEADKLIYSLSFLALCWWWQQRHECLWQVWKRSRGWTCTSTAGWPCSSPGIPPQSQQHSLPAPPPMRIAYIEIQPLCTSKPRGEYKPEQQDEGLKTSCTELN